MNKKLVYKHFLGQVKDSDEISFEFDNGTISAYLEPRAKQWSGPQDGLPPIGLEVEATYDDGKYSWGYWLNTKVLCYGSERTFVNQLSRGTENDWLEGAIVSRGLKYRAIKTKEQLAADQRETAIREFMDIVGIDCRVTASKAVDAGFKREACKSDCSTNNRGVPELLGPCDCR